MNDWQDRPSVRKLFRVSERNLEVFFYTSSDAKFLQARAVLARFGLELHFFKSHTDPYYEDYSQGRDELLKRAICSVTSQVGENSLVFVEDTSLRIDALSSHNEFPGLRVKEWFANTTFKDLDAQLRQLGRGRQVEVRSDIALHVPGLSGPVVISGLTPGIVAQEPANTTVLSPWPWLSGESFNRWFVPDGSSRVLASMSFEESWKYDFRVASLIALVKRLEEYAAVLNLPPTAYRRATSRSLFATPSLFRKDSKVRIVVGRTCAGKTTFGDRVLNKHGIPVVDASNVVRSFKDDYDALEQDAAAFARRVLSDHGADGVAKRIIEMYPDELEEHLVVTGFRTIEELEAIKDYTDQAQIIFIEASERTRYERFLTRRRDEEIVGREEFRLLDQEQWSFGLLRIAETFADIRVVNEGSLDAFYRQIDQVVSGGVLEHIPGVSTSTGLRHDKGIDQRYRCLQCLETSARPMTAAEVARHVSQSGRPIHENNVRRTLRGIPELAGRVSAAKRKVRYEITNAGRAYLRMADRQSGSK